MPDPLKAGADVSALMEHGAAPSPATAPGETVAPVSSDEISPVTLGDLRKDPHEAIQRMGAILKKDVTDPKLWLGLAAAYFAPEIFNKAAPMVVRAAAQGARSAIKGAGAMADVVSPDIVGIVSPRGAYVLRAAQRASRALSKPTAEPPPMAVPVATPPVAPAAALPTVPEAAAPAVRTPSASSSSPMSQMWQAKERLGVKLSAVEMDEGAKLVRQGMTPEQAIKALKPELPEAWQGTPTDEEVEQTVAAKNTGQRDVRARAAKQGKPPPTNPFR